MKLNLHNKLLAISYCSQFKVGHLANGCIQGVPKAQYGKVPEANLKKGVLKRKTKLPEGT